MGTKAKATRTAPEPQPSIYAPGSSFISDAEAAALISRILPVSCDANGDDAAKALALIVDRLASDDDLTTRDNNRETFFRAIFCNSAAHDDAQMAFIRSAGITA